MPKLAWAAIQKSELNELPDFKSFKIGLRFDLFSDLHLAFDFLPHSWSGLLLLTGETDDMTGDYLALLLRLLMLTNQSLSSENISISFIHDINMTSM